MRRIVRRGPESCSARLLPRARRHGSPGTLRRPYHRARGARTPERRCSITRGRCPSSNPGQKAPAFSLPDQQGTVHSLADYAGRPLVLYFYPKDDTPGCTKEACTFQAALRPSSRHLRGRRPRDQRPRQRQQGEVREEVRTDLPAARRRRSRRRREATAPGSRRACTAAAYMGIARITYLIDRDGRVAAALGQRQAGRARRRSPLRESRR